MGVIKPTNESVKGLEGLHLYHSGVSNCSMRVRLTLEEKGLSWESHHFNLMKREHITEDYFGINPNGLVPSLVHDGKVIIESDDIIEYLDIQFPEPALRPPEGPERAVMESWLRRATAIHMKAVKTHIYAKRMRGQMSQTDEQREQYERLQKSESLLEFHHKSSQDGFSQQELDAASAVLDESFAAMEQALATDPWLAGETFSLADVAWIPLYFTLGVLAGYSFDNLPHVTAWAKRIESRPSYAAAVLDWWPEEMKPYAQKSA